MASSIDKVRRVALAAGGGGAKSADEDTATLAHAADAALDEAQKIFNSSDVNGLPPHVRQAVHLVFAAGTSLDGLLDAMGLTDPDNELGDYPQLTAVDPDWMLRLAGKEPYGDVTYADPGYQEDGKKRYPLDSESHCRAAWSYINMPKNQEGYSSSQVASIKKRILAAGKKYGIEFSSGGSGS